MMHFGNGDMANDDDDDVEGDVTDQEVHACSKHPDNEHYRDDLGDADVTVAPDDVQQLQQLRRVVQTDETQEPQTFTTKPRHPNITKYAYDNDVKNAKVLPEP